MQLSKDITAIVTGGASGLGGATAEALAAHGVKVAIFDLNEAAGQANATKIGGRFYKCDVSSEVSIDAAFAAARADLGQERVLVNCAGIGVSKRITRKNKRQASSNLMTSRASPEPFKSILSAPF